MLTKQLKLRSGLIFSAMTLAIGAAALALALPIGPGDTIADRVLGQPDFVHNNGNGVDPASLDNPTGVVIDALGHLYVADASNNRVLGWTSVTALTSGAAANITIGQPDAFSNTCNDRGLSASSLCDPDGIAVDANDNLYVVDISNNRVLEYNAPFSSGFSAGQAANQVFGQAGSFTSDQCNLGAGGGFPSAQTLCSPDGLALDSLGNLYITDPGNARVLEFNTPLNPNSGEPGAGDAIADMVFGQFGSFTSSVSNNGGVSANSLASQLDGAAVDSSGNLYVSDQGNNRVLEFTNPITSHSTTANEVFGQGGNFTTNGCNQGGANASSLCTPKDLNLDGSGNLYIVDWSNARVLEFNTPLTNTTANLVLGEAGFAGGSCNSPSLGAGSLCEPVGVGHDSSGNIYVSDFGDNRMLRYAAPITTHESATLVLGQVDFTHDAANGADASSLTGPNGAVTDSSGHLYVSDSNDNRVLGYSNGTSFANGAAATLVIGQPDFSSTSCNQNTTVSAKTLCTPGRLAVDTSGNLWVVDYSNNRVMEFSAPFSSGFTANQSASIVIGQPAFGSNTCNNGGLNQKALCNPVGVALDSTGNLYISDYGNNRVLEYNTPHTVNQGGAKVFGQSAFTTNSCDLGNGTVSATTLCNPQGIAVDTLGNLYVADYNNQRILGYDTPLNAGSGEPGAGDTTADLVFGQAGSFTTSFCNNGGVSATALCYPIDVATDSANNLWAADYANNRALEFNTPVTSGTTANKVFGQGDDFFAQLCDTNGGPTADNLCNPQGLAVDSAGDLLVADYHNNRVLQYEQPLAVEAPTVPTFSPASLAFASVAKSNQRSITLNVTANGAAATNFFVPTITGTNKADFTIGTNTCVGAISPAAKCTIKVNFKPSQNVGTVESATLNVNDDAGTGSQAIAMTGASANQTTVTPPSVNFGTVTHGTTSPAKTVTLVNNQQSALTVSPASLGGTNATDFSIASQTCTASLNPFSSCTYSVTFHPAAALGAESATLKVTDSPDTLSPHNVSLLGTSN